MSKSQILHIRKLADSERLPLTIGTQDGGMARAVELGSLDDPSTPPKVTGASTSLVEEAQAEGWAVLVNPRPVVAAAGTASAPYSKTHTFVQADAITFRTTSGEVTYEVTRNPGKYRLDGTDASTVAGDPDTEVFYDYRLKIQGS